MLVSVGTGAEEFGSVCVGRQEQLLVRPMQDQIIFANRNTVSPTFAMCPCVRLIRLEIWR